MARHAITALASAVCLAVTAPAAYALHFCAPSVASVHHPYCSGQWHSSHLQAGWPDMKHHAAWTNPFLSTSTASHGNVFFPTEFPGHIWSSLLNNRMIDFNPFHNFNRFAPPRQQYLTNSCNNKERPYTAVQAAGASLAENHFQQQRNTPEQSPTQPTVECPATALQSDGSPTRPSSLQKGKQQPLNPPFPATENTARQRTATSVPMKESPIDVKVGAGHVLFTTYMPGFTADEVSVSISGQSLQIDAAHECSEKTRKSCHDSRYSRRYAPIPRGVSVTDEKHIKATFDHTSGKLLIAIPVTRRISTTAERVSRTHSSPQTQQYESDKTEDDGVTVETVDEESH